MKNPIAYQSVAYNSGVPAGLLDLPVCQQIGLTLPASSTVIQQAQSANGSCFFDYESIQLGSPASYADAVLGQLKSAVHQGKTANNSLGLYGLDQNYNKWPLDTASGLYDYPQSITFVKMLRSRGVFSELDWIAIGGYLWCAPGQAMDCAWFRLIENSIAVANATGLAPYLFITPRCQGAGAPYDGQPLDIGNWKQACMFARTLSDLGRTAATVIWDQTRFNQAWTGDVQSHYQLAMQVFA